MGNPETKLWKDLREGTKELGVFWTRIESWAMPGIPNVHGIKNGKSFWLELKVSNLKSLKSLNLRPHQISWQTQYFLNGGQVWNLAKLPSARTLYLFRGDKSLLLGKGLTGDEPPLPDWTCPAPYDWTGLLHHILSHQSHSGKKKILPS